MRFTKLAVAVTLRLTATISLAVTVVVQPVRVVEWTEVPVEIAGIAEAVIVLEIVGTAEPVAIFQMSTVAVPASTLIFQAAIVQA